MKSFSTKNIAFISILIVITVTCFFLGIWQIDRYSQKQQLHAVAKTVTEITTAALVTTHDVPALIGNTIRLNGDFIAHSVFKLDNRMFNATYGVDLYSLFKEQTSGKVFLVNMGWLEIANERDRLNQQFDFTSMHALHAKIANIPSKPPFVSMANFKDEKHKDLWLFINRDALERQFTVPVETVVLNNMEPPDELKYRVDSKENNAIMHLLYAIQWFLFSFFALYGLIKLYK